MSTSTTTPTTTTMPPAALDIEVTLRRRGRPTGELVASACRTRSRRGHRPPTSSACVDATGARSGPDRGSGPNPEDLPQGGRPARYGAHLHAKADLAAGATAATLRLRKASAVSGTPMAVVDDAHPITVDTSMIHVEVSRQHATVLDLVRDGVELLDPANATTACSSPTAAARCCEEQADAEVLSTEVGAQPAPPRCAS